MKPETLILMAIPVILGAILAAALVRDWLRRRRTQREIARGLDQRWEPAVRADWTVEDETKWQSIGQQGTLGNDWEKR